MTEKITIILDDEIISRIDEIRESRSRISFLRKIILNSVKIQKQRICSLDEFFPELKRRNSLSEHKKSEILV